MSNVGLSDQWPDRYKLSAWQSDFVQRYLKERHPRSLLVATPGTGKTITALFTAKRMLESKFSSSIIVINDLNVLRDQWKNTASKLGFNLSDSVDEYRKTAHDGLNLTVQSLKGDRLSQL